MTDIFSLIQKETERQRETLMMIPSENYAYPEVREAVGSVLMHKYSEGYPGRRYYQGNDYIDQIETAAVESAKKLFGTPHSNVQPLSGSPANSAVLLALANPGDTVMGLSLASGGHLTHGHPDITFSGKFFRSVQFSMELNGSFDFEKLRTQIEVEKPKVIFIGTTAYPRVIDFELFAHACEGFPVTLVADISHIAGLVVTGLHPNPAPHVDVITTTTHKMLRGPRGGIILVTDKGLSRDHELGKKIDRAVFPGMQGGPHDNVTAGIAIALEKAHESGYQEYTKRVLSNASVLSEELLSYGYSLVTGGTDNHLLLLDLREVKISGKEASTSLEKAGIVVNANSIPFDTASPLSPNGIRLGTPALSARNMGESEMKEIAGFIHSVLSNISDEKIILEIKKKVVSLCKKFPVDF